MYQTLRSRPVLNSPITHSIANTTRKVRNKRTPGAKQRSRHATLRKVNLTLKSRHRRAVARRNIEHGTQSDESTFNFVYAEFHKAEVSNVHDVPYDTRTAINRIRRATVGLRSEQIVCRRCERYHDGTKWRSGHVASRMSEIVPHLRSARLSIGGTCTAQCHAHNI